MAVDDGGLVGVLGLELIGRLAALALAAGLCPLTRRVRSRWPRRSDGTALGLLLGIGVGTATLLPGHAGALGAGIAGIGVAGLLAGPTGAALAATLGVIALFAADSTGTLAGLVALLASAPLGRLLARLAERQGRGIGVLDLAVLGALLVFETSVARGGFANAAMAGTGALAIGTLILDTRRRAAALGGG